MSKRINVNPDHYKVAGRERQGENVVHGVEKRALARLRPEERQIAPAQKTQKTRETRKTRKTTKREKRPMAGHEPQRVAAVSADAGGVMRRARPTRAAKAGKKR
jgi:hypothetical protein